MKTTKEYYLGAAVATALICGLAFFGCQKDFPSSPAKQNSAAKGGNPTTQTQNNISSHHAYLAAFTTAGGCTMLGYNSVVSYFGPTNCTQTIVNDVVCRATGIAMDLSSNCTMYLSTGTTTTGSSSLNQVNSNGSITQLGDLKSGTYPLYVEEMEFGPSNDLYILGYGGTVGLTLYKVAHADLGNSPIQATTIGTAFTNTHSQSYLASLAYDGTNLKVIWEVSTDNTHTNVSDISTSNAAISNTSACTGGGTVNSSDFATYYNSGNLYMGKSGTLYKLSSTTFSSQCTTLTMSTKNDMTDYTTCN